MEVILLERIERLGRMGEVVHVKNGYARNFLLPQGKALRATQGNIEDYENRRMQLEAHNLERREDAESVGHELDGQAYIVLRQASEGGQLYGSVTARDIANAITESGCSVDRRQVVLNQPIKTLGLHQVRVRLHPEVIIPVTLNIARSQAEALSQVDVASAGEESDKFSDADAFFDNPDNAPDPDLPSDVEKVTETITKADSSEDVVGTEVA
tara:strand:+ start:988 stop:1623 length:636 start_codon:yes stop_codon:yes gene_type:complete